MLSWFRRYLLPGFVFQSLCIAGGYGTGRELVAFFLSQGPVAGLLAMIPATIVVSLTCMVAFELARMTKRYDYKSFLQELLGPGWIIYEIAYLLAMLLVMAVIASAAGAMMSETYGLPAMAATIPLLGVIAFLAFKGSRVIEGVMSVWSFVLYAVYFLVFLLSVFHFGPAIAETLQTRVADSAWFLSGTRYGALQLALLPVILFATTHIQRRSEAFIAGALAGPILMIPALLFFFALLAHYPDILERPVPVNHILEALESPFLLFAFPLVLLGTFIETGTGMIHGFNERIAGALEAVGRTLPDIGRPVVAVLVITAALLLSRWGIIDLIEVGYGAMTWVFILVIVLPLLTVGAWRVWRALNEGTGDMERA